MATDNREAEQNALLKALARIYKRYPNLRLGQIIADAMPHSTNCDDSVRKIGDTELLVWLLKTEKDLAFFDNKKVQ